MNAELYISRDRFDYLGVGGGCVHDVSVEGGREGGREGGWGGWEVAGGEGCACGEERREQCRVHGCECFFLCSCMVVCLLFPSWLGFGHLFLAFPSSLFSFIHTFSLPFPLTHTHTHTHRPDDEKIDTKIMEAVKARLPLKVDKEEGQAAVAAAAAAAESGRKYENTLKSDKL